MNRHKISTNIRTKSGREGIEVVAESVDKSVDELVAGGLSVSNVDAGAVGVTGRDELVAVRKSSFLVADADAVGVGEM